MRLRRIYGAPVAAVSMSVEGETAAYAAAVVANGGTVSDARVAILNTFIRTEKASGAWALTDDYWGLWAEGEAQALTSLKQRRLATAVASPTFTADRGYTFNGTSNYIDPGFITLTHTTAMSGTNMRCDAYERTEGTSGYAFGGNGAAGPDSESIGIRPRNGTMLNGRLNSTLVDVSVGSSIGHWAYSRSGSIFSFYKNGSLLGTVNPVSSASTLAAVRPYIGAFNPNGTGASTFRATSIGFVSAGASLTAAQELARYNAVQAFATAVGAQV